ncbi:hypothetical protein C8R45DRAFT_1071565 [Mycena sanguinolenta]|nr:hypothetical protein C8R45DRAFT_1071565 [Mycena sanguinolenta]
MFTRLREAFSVLVPSRRAFWGSQQQRDTINIITNTMQILLDQQAKQDSSNQNTMKMFLDQQAKLLDRQNEERRVWSGQLTSSQEVIREYIEKETKLQLSIENLQTNIKRSQNNLNLRSGMEIISEILRLKTKTTGPRVGPGVQSVLDAVADGSFDAQPAGGGGIVHYQTALSDVINAIGAGGGVQIKTVGYAHASLYHTLSKYHHGGVTQTIKIHESDQTVAEAVAAMVVILFARRLWGCQLDIEFTALSGRVTTISNL